MCTDTSIASGRFRIGGGGSLARDSDARRASAKLRPIHTDDGPRARPAAQRRSHSLARPLDLVALVTTLARILPLNVLFILFTRATNPGDEAMSVLPARGHVRVTHTRLYEILQTFCREYAHSFTMSDAYSARLVPGPTERLGSRLVLCAISFERCMRIVQAYVADLTQTSY